MRHVTIMGVLLPALLAASAHGQTTESAKLLAADGAAGDAFGRSVSVNGDVALIGADNDDDNGDASGR